MERPLVRKRLADDDSRIRFVLSKKNAAGRRHCSPRPAVVDSSAKGVEMKVAIEYCAV
jgi:hypothetical protein